MTATSLAGARPAILRLAGAAAALMLMGGCAQFQPGSAQGQPQSAPVPSAPVATATASGSGATVPSTASPSPLVFPSMPDPSSALNVSKTVAKAGFASFASPSGKIWCAIYAEDALCHFPYDYTGKIPSSTKVCPGETELDVTGVMVDAKKADYFCSGDPEANPALEDSDSVGSTAWWKATGWPSVELDGQKLATLPYGRALVSGDFLCFSQTTGMTCENTANGKVFQMSHTGVMWFS